MSEYLLFRNICTFILYLHALNKDQNVKISLNFLVFLLNWRCISKCTYIQKFNIKKSTAIIQSCVVCIKYQYQWDLIYKMKTWQD